MAILSKMGDWLAGATPDDVKEAAANRTPGMKNPDVMAKAQDINRKKKAVLQKVVQKAPSISGSSGGKSW